MSVAFWFSVVASDSAVEMNAHAVSLLSPNARITMEMGEKGIHVFAQKGRTDPQSQSVVHLSLGVSRNATDRFLPLPEYWFGGAVTVTPILAGCESPLTIRQLATRHQSRPTCFDWWVTRGTPALSLSLVISEKDAGLHIPVNDGFDECLLSLTLGCMGSVAMVEKGVSFLPNVENLRFIQVREIDASVMSAFPGLRQLVTIGESSTERSAYVNQGGVISSAALIMTSICRRLRHLSLGHIPVEIPPQNSTGGDFPKLESLYIHNCRLQSRWTLPSEMRYLRYLHLDILNPHRLDNFPHCPNLHCLTISSPSADMLRVMLRGCRSLQRLAIEEWGEESFTLSEVGPVATSLKEFCIQGSLQLLVLDVSACQSLRVVAVATCEQLLSMDLGDHSPVEAIRVKRCSLLPSIGGLQTAFQLRSLEVRWCDTFEEFALSEHSLLEEVRLQGCAALVSLGGLKTASCLRILDVSYCTALSHLHVGHNRSLESIVVVGCQVLQSLEGLANLSRLHSLEMISCNGLRQLDLGKGSSLSKLRVERCGELRCLAGVGLAVYLRSLDISWCPVLHSIDLGNSKTIESITVEGCDDLCSLEGLASTSKLRSLSITWCNKLQYVDLGEGSSVEEVTLKQCKTLLSLRGIPSARQVRSVHVTLCDSFQHLDLGGCSSVEEIHLESCRSLSDIEGLASTLKLRLLCISSCSALQELDLGEGISLQEVRLKDCSGLQQARGLESVSRRGLVTVRGCSLLGRGEP